MGKNTVFFLFLTMSLIGVYLLAWPVPIEPVAFDAPRASAFEGIYKPNNLLKLSEDFSEGNGPEDVAFDAMGRIYTGMEDGSIVRFNGDGSNPELFATTRGRPLGMEFNKNGHLIVADAHKGLLSISPDGSTVRTLSVEAAGKPILFADDLTIAPSGIVYFTDASIYPIEDSFRMELMDSRPHGRLLAYDPLTHKTDVLLEGLYFPNGICLGPDDFSLLISEMLAFRIIRYCYSGIDKGRIRPFIENLPGFPNNISYNGKKMYWLAIASPSNPAIESLQTRPFVRKVILRLPSFLIPPRVPVSYGCVLGLKPDGKVACNLQDPSGSFACQITSANEYKDMLYLGTVADNGLKRIQVNHYQ